MLIKSKVAKHVDGGEEETRGICRVLTLDVTGNVTATGFVNGVLATQVGSGNNARASNESSTDVGENVAVEVTTEDDIKLMGLGHELENSF